MAVPGESNWQKTEQTEVQLIAATNSTGTNGTIHLGIHFNLKPEWKIYWRSPGDAGFPPKLKWDGSTNLKTAVSPSSLQNTLTAALSSEVFELVKTNLKPVT